MTAVAECILSITEFPISTIRAKLPTLPFYRTLENGRLLIHESFMIGNSFTSFYFDF